MKATKMSTIVVLALGLMVWPASVAEGHQKLNVNGKPVYSITLELGQSCTVEVVSDDGTSYTDYVGFSEGHPVLGDFSHLETKPEAGNLAAVAEYNEPAFYGYRVTASGEKPYTPLPGVHFIFQYEAQKVGETDVVLAELIKDKFVVIDSVHITVIPAPMGTAITYQGRLLDAGSPADGLYDFEFKLYRAPNGGIQEGNTIDVNDLDVIEGQFTVELDFGSDPNIFNGDARWLETTVAQSDGSDPATLSPRVELTPTPYAIYAESAGGDNDWMVSGSDMYSIPSGNVGIGTANPAAKLTVNGAILRDGSTMYGGIADTHINLGVSSTTGTDGRDYENATVGGGSDNTASGNTSTVGGGWLNTASHQATVGGGFANTASGLGATVGGGNGNTASEYCATVGGGLDNTASFSYATVGGGGYNESSGYFATVPGGSYNEAGGSYSFAAGCRAKANHRGTFVWGDSTDADFASTGADQFLIRASGGVGIGTTSPTEKLTVRGNLLMENSDGTKTVRILAAEGPTNGAEIKLMKADGTTTIELDAEYAGDGRILMYNSDGTETVRILAAEGPTNGAEIKLMKADGTTTIEFDAEYGGNGRIITQELQITGGSDLSEQFEVSDEGGKVKPGMVVCIDADNPGSLVVSKESYDRTVAGIVSGAGGVKTGMLMGQKGTKADGEHAVALSGRVWCWADASSGPIEPGDLLTTSDMPGHAMKVTDYTKAQGAILGKAMSSLAEGRGLVLVLVTLQ